MEEMRLKLRHNLPFEPVSIKFPDVKIFRWCNSYTDYLEIHGEHLDETQWKENIYSFAENLGSKVMSLLWGHDYVTVMLSCKCSLKNSTIRMAESVGCMIRPPVIYENAYELLDVVCMDSEKATQIFNIFSRVAEIEVMSKKTVLENDLRSLWNVQMSEIFSNLTEKQLRYFSDALSSGYFDIPKRVKIEQLAKLNDITTATMQEHLSKAESKILNSLDVYLKFFHRYISTNEMNKPEK